MKRIYTIGIYTKTENEFFEQLVSNKIDKFYDIRNRRVMRGSRYKFANSKYLQNKLNTLNIEYNHIKKLTPDSEIRMSQKKVDIEQKILKRNRNELSPKFIKIYTEKILLNYDFNNIILEVTLKEKNIVLFCVENDSGACHRSLIASKIKSLIPEIEVMHL